MKLINLPEELEIHVADKKMTWQEAMDYAESIGMRLLTKFELQVIAESTDEFNHMGYTWSASTLSNFTSFAWNVNLTNGDTTNNDKTSSRSVLCVSLINLGIYMTRLEEIRNRFEAFKEGRSTAPLPPDDTAWLIDVADVAERIYKTPPDHMDLELEKLRKALDE